ncbi:uncharacterized protein LOC127260917 [Andrographis paniculata]|uniref:uncharacterized protein LOC127260917 n=1 Tax=Andrographis paniculata TaxID=175694 RepID=UPI0021E7E9E1|nr:uncharacterized protein LOC127260917 [Andrographis paniculata]
MEKIPAACAMDWSIQLEKSLRSSKPGKSIEALEETGRRLEWWMREPELAFAQCAMFGLIPGEDKLFLNAMLLRLADAFRLGDKRIKYAVVHVFLRMKRRNRSDGKGILSLEKLDNHLELLRRVKEVFDKGDVEEKALALALFGCCAYIAKDCVDVRYIVLSSLVSEDDLSVKAALFTAGCFCELSDDFADVFLEMLSTVVLSREISSAVKLAGARTLSKSWCSFSLADKAYKTGLRLLMDSSEDDFSGVMLISLSRITSRWMLLIPIQIELLALFLSEEKSLHVQIVSLRCFRFLLAQGACKFPSKTDTLQKLFGILQRSELHPTLQLEALKTLHKILLFQLSIIPCEEIHEVFLKLYGLIKPIQLLSIASTTLLYGKILADLSAKVLRRGDIVSSGNDSTLAVQLISFILDDIISLLTPKVDIHHPESASELVFKSMIDVLKKLIQRYPHLHCLVLSSMCLCFDKLMGMLNRATETEKFGMSDYEMTEFDSNLETLLKPKLLLSVANILFACLQNLEETDAETNTNLDLLKVQAESLSHHGYVDIYTRISYFCLLHLHSTFICMRHMVEELISPSREMGASSVGPVPHFDVFSLDCAMEILGRKRYWSAYKVGRNAACQGAWSTAAFMFEQLVPLVKSSSSACWLKSLAQFTTSERDIQLFLLPNPSKVTVGERRGITSAANCGTYMEYLLRAWNTVVSAEKNLAASDSGGVFSFQRWFLALRAKFLKTTADMMKLLDTASFLRAGTKHGGELHRGNMLRCSTPSTLGSLMHSSLEISSRMKRAARELDLLLISFVGIDRQSMTTISALALSCSLMAFTAGFSFLLPCGYSSENYRVSKSEQLDEPFCALLIEDLMWRLRREDTETREKLMILLEPFINSKDCFSRSHTRISPDGIILQKLCQFSVGEVFRLQSEATNVQPDDAASLILCNGSQLLVNFISKLLLVPMQTPRTFFIVRPAVSSELFVMNEDNQVVDRSSTLSGSHFSLSLCLQLKNMPADLPHRLSKIYCIISCKAQPQATTATGEPGEKSQPDQDIDDMMELNEKLLTYIVGSLKTNELHSRDEDDGVMVNEYVCFDINERGQGFSTCFLDVSSLPSGCHSVKWHCGGMDRRGSYWSLLPMAAGPLFTVSNAATLR